MDTATPIASRGHFTTLTTGSIGARCLKFPSMPHPVTGVRLRMVAQCTCSHKVRNCSSQTPRWSHQHQCMQRAVHNVPAANP